MVQFIRLINLGYNDLSTIELTGVKWCKCSFVTITPYFIGGITIYMYPMRLMTLSF